MSIKVDVDTKKLDALLNGLGPKAEKVIHTAAIKISKGAKEMAPVDTGALKGSIHVRKYQPFERVIGDGVEYGIHQEFGAPANNMPAQPFMTPALEKERGPFKRAWKALLK